MITYERATSPDMFPTLTREAYDVWAAADAAADAALAAYEAAEQAVSDAINHRAPHSERRATRAALDTAEHAMTSAIEARDRVTPS